MGTFQKVSTAKSGGGDSDGRGRGKRRRRRDKKCWWDRYDYEWTCTD